MRKLKWMVLCLLPFCFFGFPKESHAASEQNTIQFTLHKLLFENGEMPDPQLNTGQEQSFLQDYRGLNDVTFAAYDVTETFYQLRKAGDSVEDAQKKIADQGESAGTKITTQRTKKIGNEEGIADFQLSRKDSQQRDCVYLFKEIDAPKIVKEKAANLVVALPVYDSMGKALATIHLYPKNEENSYPVPPFEKKIEEKKQDFTIGDKIHYSLNTTIPMNILDYERFTISDQGVSALTFLPETIHVSINGKNLSEGYHLNSKSNGFTIDFALDTLKKYAGQSLKITYQMYLNEKAVADEAVKNEGTLTVDSSSFTDQAFVYTGGKNFLKVDNETQKGLADAAFVVKDSKGNYLSQQSSRMQWVNKREKATPITSDEHGNFSIIGLAYGTYQLEEIQSPKGYRLNKAPIPFEVTKYSYQQEGEHTPPLKVVNKKVTETGFLPKTNEQRTTLWGALGFLMMLFVIYLLIKRKLGVKK